MPNFSKVYIFGSSLGNSCFLIVLVTMEPLSVVKAEFYPKDNAKESKTEEYDLLDNPEASSPILRRGCTFCFSLRFDRNFDEVKDVVRVGFGFGKVIYKVF